MTTFGVLDGEFLAPLKDRYGGRRLGNVCQVTRMLLLDLTGTEQRHDSQFEYIYTGTTNLLQHNTFLFYMTSTQAAFHYRIIPIKPSSREVERCKEFFEHLALLFFLRLALPAVFPVRALLETQQLAEHAAAELQIEAE